MGCYEFIPEPSAALLLVGLVGFVRRSNVSPNSHTSPNLFRALP